MYLDFEKREIVLNLPALDQGEDVVQLEIDILMFKFIMVVVLYCFSYFIRNYRETNENLENQIDLKDILEDYAKKMH